MNGQGPLLRRFLFFLGPKFSMTAFATAVEPLRLANRFLPRPAYDWLLVSSDGNPVEASNGLSINVDRSLAEISDGRLDCARLEPSLFERAVPRGRRKMQNIASSSGHSVVAGAGL